MSKRLKIFLKSVGSSMINYLLQHKLWAGGMIVLIVTVTVSITIRISKEPAGALKSPLPPTNSSPGSTLAPATTEETALQKNKLPINGEELLAGLGLGNDRLVDQYYTSELAAAKAEGLNQLPGSANERLAVNMPYGVVGFFEVSEIGPMKKMYVRSRPHRVAAHLKAGGEIEVVLYMNEEIKMLFDTSEETTHIFAYHRPYRSATNRVCVPLTRIVSRKQRLLDNGIYIFELKMKEARPKRSRQPKYAAGQYKANR